MMLTLQDVYIDTLGKKKLTLCTIAIRGKAPWNPNPQQK